MTNQEFTFESLKRIMMKAAGADEKVDFDGDILDKDFTDLGYESLALLETSSRIEREYGIVLEESTVVDAETPRALIDAVNSELRNQSQPTGQN